MCIFQFSRWQDGLKEPVRAFNEISNNLQTPKWQKGFSGLSFKSGSSTGISPTNLTHDLVEEKHSDDQETQNPPIGVWRVKDTENS